MSHQLIYNIAKSALKKNLSMLIINSVFLVIFLALGGARRRCLRVLWTLPKAFWYPLGQRLRSYLRPQYALQHGTGNAVIEIVVD